MKLKSTKPAAVSSEDQSVPESVPAAGGAKGIKYRKSGRPRKKRSWKWIAAVLIVLVVAGIFLVRTLNNMRNAPVGMNSGYTYAEVERRDITSTLEGSGTLEPADSYTVTTLVSGEILAAQFEEGDVVAKGNTLYEVDSSNAASNIERSELSLSQIQRSYNNKVSSLADLTITAPIGGTVTGVTAQVGNTVGNQTAIATIEDTSSLTLTEYYSDEYEGRIYSGMPATVSVADQMLNLMGTVKEVSSLKRVSPTGISCFAVTVEVANIGSLTSGMSATCWLISDGGGEIYPAISDDNGFDAKNRTTVYAGVSGTVTEILVRNNETVSAGQIIMTLSSDTLSDEILNAADSLKDAELSLKNQYDSLDDYIITAPIDGTIVDKFYKQGEKAEAGRTLCTIYDLSSLTFVMNVDELDIGQVSVGQKATITADAVKGAVYEGVITKVGINGAASGGVTTYPVTVRIDKTDGLLPGMNVDVSVILERASGVLAIPAASVERGDRVLVKTSDGSTGEGAPDGLEYAEIVTGISDGDYVQIISGLSGGDTVAYIPKVAESNNMFVMFNGGGGAMPAGGGNTTVRSYSTQGGGMP